MHGPALTQRMVVPQRLMAILAPGTNNPSSLCPCYGMSGIMVPIRVYVPARWNMVLSRLDGPVTCLTGPVI
eukprot:3940661-Rhodomonas_salina.3